MEYPLDNNFTYHKPRAKDVGKFTIIRSAAKQFAGICGDMCPEGRELALTRTKIEEAVFWANAAIARQGEITDMAELEEGLRKLLEAKDCAVRSVI